MDMAEVESPVYLIHKRFSLKNLVSLFYSFIVIYMIFLFPLFTWKHFSGLFGGFPGCVHSVVQG